MKYIPLTQGKVAIVDDEDYDYLMQWKWYAHYDGYRFYAARSIHTGVQDGKKIVRTIKMHRLIMNPPAIMKIDHINRDGLDNRKSNLRIVTHRENQHFYYRLRNPFQI